MKTFTVTLFALVLTLSGCAGLFPGQSQTFSVQLALTGDVSTTVPLDLGRLSFPAGLNGAPLALKLAEIYLADTLQWKSCTFSAPVTSTGENGALSVSASATCLLKGQPITEGLLLALVPQ